MKNIHRINDFALVKFIDPADLQDFITIPANLEMGLQNKQYLLANDLNNTVWESGDYQHSVNKIYSSAPLFVPDGTTMVEELNFINAHFLLTQGFRWDNLYGIHVIFKNSKTNEVLVSKIVTIEDFSITGDKELIDGSFWLEEVILKIPRIKDIMSCQITPVLFDDINNLNGLIYNFPQQFVLMVDEKPIPDYIRTLISFDENHYLTVALVTDESKTIEKSLLDYFEITRAVIEVSHIIMFGNELYGYNTLRVSNEDNKYLPIKIGLNLLPYFVGGSELVNIYVSTEILVDNKLIKREAQLNTTMDSISPMIIAQVTHPDTNFHVEVVKTTTINQTIVEAKQSTKIIPIFQPVFMELITETIEYQNKNIYFDKIVSPGYLKIRTSPKNIEQVIFSKITSDNRFYFDLTELQPILEDTTYEIVDASNLKIIGKGKILFAK